MGQILATNITSFIEDELMEDGTGHINSLHITVVCTGLIVARILINNGSTLNVCPLVTLDRLVIDWSSIEEMK